MVVFLRVCLVPFLRLLSGDASATTGHFPANQWKHRGMAKEIVDEF